MIFPKDTREELDAFYGKHVIGADGKPTAKWEQEHLQLFKVPYPLTLSFDKTVTVTKIRCHKLVGENLVHIFEQILEQFGNLEEVKRARVHLYGGCYNFRPIKDSVRLSTHSWGAGIDLDPERNGLGKPHDLTKGMMRLEVVRIFEKEGWKWGGRFKSRPDCMHFQAAS